MSNQEVLYDKPALTTNKTNPITIFFVVFSGCMLLLLAMGGSYLLGVQNKKLSQAPINYQSKTPSVPPVIENDGMQDWKVYANPSLAIRFKYPQEFTVYEDKTEDSTYAVTRIRIVPSGNKTDKPAQREIFIWIEDNPEQLSPLEWFLENRKKDTRKTTPARYNETKINNYDAVTNLDETGLDHITVDNYTLTHNDKAYSVSYDDFTFLGKENTVLKTIDEITFSKIISSLTFK